MRTHRLRLFTQRAAAFAVAGIAMLALATMGARSATNDDAATMRAAAVVNDIVISTYDLDQRVKLAMVTSGQAPSAEMAKRLRGQILRQLIDEMLQLQEAQKYSIKVSADDVQGAFKRITSQNNITIDQINKMLDDNGVARTTLQQQLQADIAWQKLVQQRLSPRVTVSQDEVDAVLARMKEQGSAAQYLAAEIFIAVEDPSQEETAKQNVQNILSQLHGGGSFSAVARQFSQSSTASQGGDMGWVTAADLQPEVAKVVTTMRTGTVSDPIRAGGGYYIVGLREKRLPAGSTAAAEPEPAAPPPQATQPKAMAAKVSLTAVQIPMAAGASKAKQEQVKQTAIKLFQSINGCGNVSAVAKANGATATSLGVVSVKDLAPDFRKLLERTPNGRATPPLTSSAGVQMFVICSGGMQPGSQPQQAMASGPSKPFVVPTEDEVQNRLYSQELSMLSRRYLRDLRRDASIEIRDN